MTISSQAVEQNVPQLPPEEPLVDTSKTISAGASITTSVTSGATSFASGYEAEQAAAAAKAKAGLLIDSLGLTKECADVTELIYDIDGNVKGEKVYPGSDCDGDGERD